MKREDFYCYDLVRFIVYTYVIGIVVFCVVIAICGIISLPWLIGNAPQAVGIGIIVALIAIGLVRYKDY